MKKFIDWHKEQMFWFMTKFNLGLYEVAWIAWFKGLLLGALLLLLCSCGVQLKTGYVDPIYNNCCDKDIILEVPDTVEIDTLSFSQLKWKLRTDFNFRWDYAQFAMNQPYNWYSSNFSYNIWRPFNSFDVYFNRYDFWYDWAFNYPYYWGYSSWHNPWRHNWYRPYNWGYSWYNGPWHNSSYNIIWNSSRENNNIAYIRGRRGSNNIEISTNNNIQNKISRRYNYPRPNVNNNNLDNIVNILRDNYNVKPRVYNNPNNIPNNNNIKPNWNNSKPIYNNNNNINTNSSIRNNNSFSPPPRSSNISRGSSTSSGGSSRGGNSKGRT